MDPRTGTMILMPAQSDLKTVLLAIAAKENRPVKNIAQTRKNTPKMKNGNYVLAKSRGWGSGMQLNSYSYTPNVSL